MNAGFENMMINAPNILQAAMQGYQAGEMYRNRAAMRDMSQAMIQTAQFGMDAEPMLDVYEARMTAAASQPGGQSKMLVIQDEFNKDWKALHHKHFGSNPPKGVTPPPSEISDGLAGLQGIRKWFDGTKGGMVNSLVNALAVQDPMAAAKFMTQVQQERDGAKQRNALGVQFGEAMRSGDKPTAAKLAIQSGDPNVFKAMDLFNEPGKKQAPNIKTFPNKGATVTGYFDPDTGRFVQIGSNPIQEKEKRNTGAENILLREMLGMDEESRKTQSDALLPPEEKAAAMGRINTGKRKVAAMLEEMQGGGAGAAKKKGGKTPSHTAKADTNAIVVTEEAKAALKKGAPPDKVRARLREMGINPALAGL